MRSFAVLTLVLAFVKANQPPERPGLIRPGPEPFLKNTYKCKGRTGANPDPDFCDRWLTCFGDYSVVKYCPTGMVYFGAGKCRKISGLSAEQLEKTCSGRTLETPNKPKVRCVHTPLHSESIKFYPINTKNSDDTYLKIDPDFKYTHHLCHNGKLMVSMECYDPERPEIVMEGVGSKRCQPLGASRNAQITQNEKNLPATFTSKIPGARDVDYRGLPIIFKGRLPRCPKHDFMRKHFRFTVASRIADQSDCIHFWTCNDQFTKALKSSCPVPQVFDPQSENCIFYKQAAAPCNHVYDYLPEETLARYQRMHELKKKAEEGENYFKSKRKETLLEQFEAQRSIMRAATPKTPEMRQAVTEAFRIKAQLDESFPGVLRQLYPSLYQNEEKEHSRVKRSFHYENFNPPRHLGRIDFDTEYFYNDFVNVTALEGGQDFRCPPVKLKPGVTFAEVELAYKSPHFNAHNYYSLDSFMLGSFTYFPVVGKCNQYHECGPTQHVQNENKAVTKTCGSGVFQPLKIKPYNALHQFAIVPKTGRCIFDVNARSDFPGCENYKPAQTMKNSQVEAEKNVETEEKIYDPDYIAEQTAKQWKEYMAEIKKVKEEESEQQQKIKMMVEDSSKDQTTFDLEDYMYGNYDEHFLEYDVSNIDDVGTVVGSGGGEL